MEDFDVMKQKEEEIKSMYKRFQELLVKYKDDVDEVLEFAKLYDCFIRPKKDKYI